MERGTATCVLPTLIKYSAASQTFGHRHSRVSIVLQPPPPPQSPYLTFVIFYIYTFRSLKILHSKVCWWQIWSMSLPELQQLDQRPNNSLSASQNCTSSANVFRKGGIWNLGFKHHRKILNLTIITPTVLFEHCSAERGVWLKQNSPAKHHIFLKNGIWLKIWNLHALIF